MPVGVGAALLCAAACAGAVVRHGGRGRLAWGFLAAASLWWPVAESAFGLGMAGAAPLAAAALLLIPTGARRRQGLGDVVEAALTAMALLVVVWTSAFQPILDASHGLSPVLGSLAELGGDVLLGTAVVMLLTRASGRARVSLVPLALGLLTLAAADAAMLRTATSATRPAGGYATAVAVAFLLIAGAAAVAVWRPVAGSARQRRVSRIQSVAPYLYALAGIAAFVTQTVSGHPVQPFMIAAIPVLFALVVLRQQLMLADRDRLLLALGASERELSHRTDHDPLTDLPNRSYFLARLERALSWRRRRLRDGHCTVMLVDLDHFERVNAQVGHKEGDRVLMIVADRLRESLRAVDTIARVGGDEFAVLFDEVPSASDLVEVGERLVNTLHTPIACGDQDVIVEASAGIALCGPKETPMEAEEMLRRADIALRMAKQNGRGAFGVFESSLRVAMEEPRRRHSGIRQALGLRQFVLHYQPIVDVARRRIVGVEALLRWRHPEAGLLSPDEFLVDLEDVGLLRSVGRWVIEEAISQTAELRNQLGVDLFVTVNVSATQLRDEGFVLAVGRVLRSSGLLPAALVIEITESGNIAEDRIAVERLERLRGLGVRLAIDDFGTGYSSMSYLHRFQVDVLKVDKSFIGDLTTGGAGAKLAEELIRLGHTMGLVSIAEGVETDEQHDALAALSCPLAQGFHYAGPLNRDQLTMLMRQDVAFPLESRRSA